MKNLYITKETDTVYMNFVSGKEYQLHIVNENTCIPKDFFYKTYCEAFEEVKKIIAENESKSQEEKFLETTNNIIAFCGERGQGKSSVMLSFSKMLKNFKNYKQHFSNTTTLEETHFHILGRIDPTELESRQSILSVIISKIFFDFKTYMNDSNVNSNFEEKNQLLSLFQKCYRNIDIIKKTMNSTDNYIYEGDLDALSAIADSLNMKKDFSNLIEKFLNVMCTSSQNSFLVIQVDDTDLNIKKAYEIVEDIRKYFMIPKVIVLMATKPDLLTAAIESTFMSSFNVKPEKKLYTPCNFYEMASRYILKLIPGSRRIDLPDINSTSSKILNNKMSVNYFKENNNENIFDFKDINGNKLESLQSNILRYIYEKTGLIFVETEGTLHSIIPTTTRSLANFVAILNDLPTIEKYESFEDMPVNEAIKRLNNLNRFEDYFVNSLVEENVNNQYHENIEKWINTSWKDKNHYTLLMCKKIMASQDFEKYVSDKEYFNVSEQNLETVLNALNELNELDYDKKMYSFIFAIKTLYSIHINKMMMEQIIDEKCNENISNLENTNIIDFVGNSIFLNMNSIFPYESHKYKRAQFNSFSSDEILRNLLGVKEDNAETFIGPLLLGDYISIDESNEYKFNISLPILRLLQIKAFVNKTINGILSSSSNTDKICSSIIESLFKKYDVNKIRYFCFQIISNIDLIEKISKGTAKLFLRSSTDYISFGNSFYSQINNTLKQISYLDLGRFELGFFDYIFASNTLWLNDIYENRRLWYLRNESDIPHVMERVSIFQNALQAYTLTNTLDLLKTRIKDTIITFSRIRQTKFIDLSFELKEIQTINEKIANKKDLQTKSCLNYQAVINKLRKSAVEKLDKYITSILT